MNKLISRIIRIISIANYHFLIFVKKFLSFENDDLPRIMFGLGTHNGSAALLKVSKLKALFGNSIIRNNILYICSGNIPLTFCMQEKKRGSKIILNQNGVYFPAWYGKGYKEANKRHLLGHYQLADHIIYQSIFCKESAEKFLGKAQCPSEIMYNSVDTSLFVPGEKKLFNPDAPVLLATGIFYGEVRYERMHLLITAFKIIHMDIPGARLVIAGYFTKELWAMALALINKCGIKDSVILLPSYKYADAPAIYQKGDIYINTQLNDCCPSAVLEAMSCSLPVAYLNCGGTPELVEDAGEAVSVEKSWENSRYPEPELVKDAVLKVVQNYSALTKRARERCIEHFDQLIWRQKHEVLFKKVLKQ